LPFCATSWALADLLSWPDLMDHNVPETPRLAARLVDGEPAALARAISLVESDTRMAIDILRAIRPHLGHAVVVGFTGPPGAGKSTLVNAYIAELRKRGKTVGVVAVDPSSPITGGAVLGDRIRMAEHTLDQGVFIRSLASRGALGGLSAAAAQVADLMDAAGRDVVILETVGTGQSEVEMATIVDIRVVISSQTHQQLKTMLGLRGPTERSVPVLCTDAINRAGVGDLADAVDALADRTERRDDRSALAGRTRHLLAQAVSKAAETHVMQSRSEAIALIVQGIQEARLSLSEGARQVLNDLGGEVHDG
jgi:LAO/AO transport system kinase